MRKTCFVSEFLGKHFWAFLECFKYRNFSAMWNAFFSFFFVLCISRLCVKSHLSVFVPSNYTEKGLKAGPLVGMEIYMHPRIIIMKAARRKETKKKLEWTTFVYTEIGYGHFEIISLKDLVLKRKTRGNFNT